jgi:hypothetical protein
MPTCIDHLRAAVAELQRMQAAAVGEDCPMLALTLQLAHDEAEEELARRTATSKALASGKKASASRAGSNVIRFPRRRLAKRRNARGLAEHCGGATGQLLNFADHASR